MEGYDFHETDTTGGNHSVFFLLLLFSSNSRVPRLRRRILKVYDEIRGIYTKIRFARGATGGGGYYTTIPDRHNDF